MKKLMTMISAVAVAFGLQAAEPYPSGSAFNGETLDETEQALWSSTEGLSIDKEVTTVGYTKPSPAQFEETTKGSSLKISTSLSAPVYRAIVAGATPQDIGTGVYVDTLVKFTAFDPEDVATIDGTSAKLAVWVKEVEGETPSYQLMVTAGHVDNETVTVMNYVCTPKSAINTDDWYRLTIKSIKNIDGNNLMGFVVFVDGEAVSCGESKFANVTLSQQAALWNDTGKLFPALVKQDSTLKQVGFAGQGHIDDFSITDVAPSFAADLPLFTVKGGDNVLSFTVGTKTWNKGDAPLVFIANGDAPTSAENIVYATGYFGDVTQALEIAKDAALTVGNAKPLAATVTIDGTETKCATLKAAVEAVNAAESAVKLTLGAQCTEELMFDNANNAAITLDLAGWTVSMPVYATTKLIVVDSVGTGKVDENLDADGGLEILGGKFLASKNSHLAKKATVPKGMELKENPDDGYLSLVASAPTKPETWEGVTDDTPMTDLPGVTEEVAGALTDAGVTVSAVKTWATGSGAVLAGAPINLDAFVMDAANAATPAELAAKAAAEITQEVLDAIVAAGTAADLSAIATKYPNATVTVVPATELVSTDTAKFFKLKFELKVAP